MPYLFVETQILKRSASENYTGNISSVTIYLYRKYAATSFVSKLAISSK